MSGRDRNVHYLVINSRVKPIKVAASANTKKKLYGVAISRRNPLKRWIIRNIPVSVYKPAAARNIISESDIIYLKEELYILYHKGICLKLCL